MPLGIVTLSDTFQLSSVTRLNSLILFMNELTEGQHNSTGIITLTGGGFRDNVTMNVANGQIKGDGGAIWNIGASFVKISGQANNSLIQNNYINIVSNVGSLLISTTGPTGNTRLGNTVYVTLNISTSTADLSTVNLAAIKTVNTTMNVAVAAFAQANIANTQAFSVSLTDPWIAINAAHLKANQANLITVANTLANGYALIRSSSRTKLNFREDATTPDIKVNVDDDSAGDRANVTFAAPGIGLAFNKANAANATAEAGIIHANAAHRAANTAQTDVAAAFSRANSDIISLLMNGPLTAYNNANVIPYCTYPFNVDYAYYRLGAGSTVRIQVRNGTTNVTNMSALSATTAGKINVATALNSFAIGDRLQITLTGQTASEQNLELVFAITRT